MKLPNKGISILQWNSRSAVSNRHEIIHLIRTHDIQIAAISETWFPPLSGFEIPGFSCHRDDRADGRGGAAILIKTNIPHLRIKLPYNSRLQIVAINVFNMTLVSVYIPPKETFDLNFWSSIKGKFLKTFIILGDCNAHSPLWGGVYTDPSGSNIMDFIDEHFLCVLNDGSPTRICRPGQRPSAVDISISTPDVASITKWSIIKDPHSSDHFPIVILLGNTHSPKQKARSTRLYNIRKAKWREFKSLLNSNKQNFGEKITPENVSQAAQVLQESFINAAEASIPKVSLKTPKASNPPWWDEECTQVVKERKTAMRIYEKNMTFYNFNEASKAQAIAKRTLKRKKRQGWRKFCTELSPETPIGEVWSGVKRFRGAYSSCSHFETEEWIEEFANILAPPHVPLASEFPISLSAEGEAGGIWGPFRWEELIAAISKSRDSAPGYDNIPYAFFENSPDTILKFSLDLFNVILTSGVIPQQWKKQVIVPIPKAGKDPLLGESYRPIALSSCLLKVLERMIKSRMEWFLESNELLPQWQFGFRKAKSCLDSLSVITTDIRVSQMNKSSTVAAFLDIDKAYDKVLLPLLKDRLIRIGIPPKISQLIFNIMAERHVVIDSGRGPIERIRYEGLPQGSVLSPLLFNVYTLEIQSLIPEQVSILQYADDFVLYSSDKNVNSAASRIEDTLQKMNV